VNKHFNLFLISSDPKNKFPLREGVVSVKHMKFVIILIVGMSFAFSAAIQASLSPARDLSVSSMTGQEKVSQIFSQNCSISGCHKGSYPAMNLDLDKDKFLNSLLNVQSQELRELKLVDTENPEKSYLLMKIKGDEAIVGRRMPIDAPPLNEDDIQTIEDWIRGLEDAAVQRVEAKETSEKARFRKPAFWGTRIINLPTTRSIGKGRVLFRISHRYFPAVKEGYDFFYGLDGPAAIFLSLGYGISDNLSITIGRTNLLKETEFSIKWIMVEQGKKLSVPFSAGINLGGSLITRSQPGKETFRSENSKLNLQFVLSHQVTPAVSFLIVPAYSSNTHPLESSSEGTFALGLGSRFMFLNDLSLIVEWIPVLSGYTEDFSGWGIGLEKKIGGHVFQVFILNSVGLTSAQFIPGGEFRLGDREFRVGFNIFRWF